MVFEAVARPSFRVTNFTMLDAGMAIIEFEYPMFLARQTVFFSDHENMFGVDYKTVSRAAAARRQRCV
jgi:hypothetical protein